MKLTKFLNINFNASPYATIEINIPFKVKTMHVKSYAYEPAVAGTTNYMAVISDIGNSNQPLLVCFQDDTYSSTTVADIEISFEQPTIVQGIRNFRLARMSGAIGATSNAGAGNDWLGLIMEFNDEYEP